MLHVQVKVLDLIRQQKGVWHELVLLREESLESADYNAENIFLCKMLAKLIQINITKLWNNLTSMSGYLLIMAFRIRIKSISWSLRATPYQYMLPSPLTVLSLKPFLLIMYCIVSISALQWLVFITIYLRLRSASCAGTIMVTCC